MIVKEVEHFLKEVFTHLYRVPNAYRDSFHFTTLALTSTCLICLVTLSTLKPLSEGDSPIQLTHHLSNKKIPN